MSSYSIPVLDNQINTAPPYVEEHKDRIMIGDKFINIMKAVQKEFNETYAVYKIKNERTEVITAKFKGVRKETETVLRELHQFVNHNVVGFVPTEEDRKNLFTAAPSGKSPIGIPTETAIIDIIKRLVRQLFVQISYGVAPNINYRRLPDGVKGVQFFVAFTNLGDPAPEDTDYHFFKNSTNSDAMLQFTDADAGRQVYIKTAFYNDKGELGPMSNAVHTAVPN